MPTFVPLPAGFTADRSPPQRKRWNASFVNREWLACFPDPHDRPARHVLIHALPGAMQIQLEIIAVVDA
jgi:hypothetical protein